MRFVRFSSTPEKKLLRGLLRTDDVDARLAALKDAFKVKTKFAILKPGSEVGDDEEETDDMPDVMPPAFIECCKARGRRTQRRRFVLKKNAATAVCFLLSSSSSSSSSFFFFSRCRRLAVAKVGDQFNPVHREECRPRAGGAD